MPISARLHIDVAVLLEFLILPVGRIKSASSRPEARRPRIVTQEMRARRSEFRERIQLDRAFKIAWQKYFDFGFHESVLCCVRSAPAGGAYASSRTWSGMRWTGRCCQTCSIEPDGEVVWSWRAHARAKFLRDSKVVREERISC